MSSVSDRCPKCGTRLTGKEEYCPACGHGVRRSLPNFRNSDPSTPDSRTVLNPPVHTANDGPRFSWPDKVPPTRKTFPDHHEPVPRHGEDFFLGLFRHSSIKGTVISVDQPRMEKKHDSPVVIVSKLVLGILLLPVILVLVLVFAILKLFIFGAGGGHRGGFFSGFLSHLFSFFLIGKLHGTKDTVQVIDARLRDDSSTEHLIRVQGELVTGNFNVGDLVTVQGPNRNGTLFVKTGWNHRTNAHIKVRIR